MKKTKFQIKKEETYHKLIEAGIKVIYEKGYTSTSIDQIVEMAGYSKGAFYVHFSSKEDFFLQLLNYRTSRRKTGLTALQELISSKNSLHDMIEIIVEFYFTYLKEDKEWNAVFIEFFVAARTNESIKVHFEAMHREWIKEGQMLFTILQEKGVLSKDANVSQLATRLYSYIDGLQLHELIFKQSFTKENLYHGFYALLSRN